MVLIKIGLQLILYGNVLGKYDNPLYPVKSSVHSSDTMQKCYTNINQEIYWLSQRPTDHETAGSVPGSAVGFFSIPGLFHYRYRLDVSVFNVLVHVVLRYLRRRAFQFADYRWGKAFQLFRVLITRDGYCTREIKMRIAIAKEAFNRKISLLTSKMIIELRKKLVRFYVWSITLYGLEIWTLRKL